MWLFPQPDAYVSCSVSVERESDLAALVGTLSDLQRRNIVQNSPSVSNLFRQAIVSAMDPEVIRILGPYLGHKNAIPEAVLEEIRVAKGWGWWKAQFAIYGPESIAVSSWDYVKAAFAKVPGARCEGELVVGVDGQPVMASDLPEEDIPHAGIPHLKNLALMDYRGKGSGHICFSPILPPSGRELYDWYLTSKQRTIDAGFDFFADFHIFPRYVIAIELVVFAEEEAQKCDDLYRILAEDAVKQGYSEYRTHVAYMDLIADHFDYNDSALRKYVDLLKDVTDPKGVLSPGKQGIWGTSKIATTARSRIANAYRGGEDLNGSRNGHL
jgi:4-cresol dehydrogenase (hydroxylating)